MSRNVRTTKLGSLPEAQRAALIRWLFDEKVIYRVAVDRLQKEFGVESNISAICKFWHRVCKPGLARNENLEIKIFVREGEKIIGETQFSVALTAAAASQPSSNSGNGSIVFHVKSDTTKP